MKTEIIKIPTNNNLKEAIKSNNLPAKTLIAFLLSNGWKSEKHADESSIRMLYTKAHVIRSVSLDINFVYLDCVTRGKIELETITLSEKEIYISSSSTVFARAAGLSPIDCKGVLLRVKAIRKKCRSLGVKFSAPSASTIAELLNAYKKELLDYNNQYKEGLNFWRAQVAHGLYSGLHETRQNPLKGIETRLYRDKALSQAMELDYRISNLEKANLGEFLSICL